MLQSAHVHTAAVLGPSASAAPLSAQARLLEAVRRKDFERARAHMTSLQQLQAASSRQAQAAACTQLRLTPSKGGGLPLILSAAPANTTEFHALFVLPESLAPGSYRAEVSNGASTATRSQWTALQMFESPEAPAVRASAPLHTGFQVTVHSTAGRVSPLFFLFFSSCEQYSETSSCFGPGCILLLACDSIPRFFQNLA